MATLLLKTEPSTFSFADLAKAGETTWDGVTNAAALLALRSARRGDAALIYHTAGERAIVGLAEITSGAFEDPRKPGLNAHGEPKFAVVKLRARQAAPTPVTLEALKADARFKGWALLTQPRLSVMAVPAKLDTLLRSMAGLG